MWPMFRKLKGMRDLLSPDTDRWRALVEVYAEHAARAGYGEVVPPVLEELGVFLRMGESTDVVTKEMYDFTDKDGDRIAMRPEFTAGLMRVFLQNRPQTLPWKIWAWGPTFRHEKPQGGRFRQFMQLDAECVGSNDPDVDVEMIALANDFFRALGLRKFTVKINSLGDETCRPAYFEALRKHFDENIGALTAESRSTLEINPLRVLDSKRPPDFPIIEAAPRMIDFLSDETGTHFARVLSGLDRIGVAYEVTPRLVRGLDYYTHTLFEFASDALETSQNAIGGGGHYNNLIEQLGGPSIPGVGFALGIDRVLMACDAEGVFDAPSSAVDVFVIDTTGGLEALSLCTELRRAGIRADRSFDAKSMKSQFKDADRSGAAVALVVGSDELVAGTVLVRDLRGEERIQHPVARSEVVARVADGVKRR